MAGRPLATAFVRIKTLVDPAEVKRDTDAALRAAGPDKAGQDQGKKLGLGMATGLRGSSPQITAGLGDAVKDGLKKVQDQVESGMGKAGDDAGKLAGKSFADRITEVTKRAATIPIGIDDKAAQATMLRLTAKLSDLSKKVARPGITVEGEERALAGILDVEVALDKLDAKSQAAGFAAAAAAAGKLASSTQESGNAAQSSYGWWGLLRKEVSLFGGTLGTVPLAGTVTGLHLLIDSLIEVAAVAVPAAIAFGAFGAAAIPALQDIYTQETNVSTVSQALALQMPGLSGGFEKVADAVKPQVYVLFGEALNTINRNTGTFSTLATGAGHVLDSLGARAELALGSKGMNGFISKGVDDLQLLGDIGGNVLGILGNLLKSMPGTAELLFGALKDVTGALESLTSSGAVQGILNIGTAFHGALLWGGLAVSAILALKGPLTGIGTWAAEGAARLAGLGVAFAAVAAEEGILTAASIALDAVNPFVWVGLAVGALVALGVALSSVKTSAQSWYASVEASIGTGRTFNDVLTTTSQAVIHANSQLAQTPRYIEQADGAVSRYTGGSVRAVTEQYAQWGQNAQKLHAQLSTEQTRMSQLTGIFGSAANAQAAFNAIGLKSSDIAKANAAQWAADITQLKAYQTATVTLAGYQGGQALAAQNALNVASNQQALAIGKVTQAEDQLITTVIGGQQSFTAFQQSMSQLAIDAGVSTGYLNRNNYSLKITGQSAIIGAKSLGGLNDASLKLSGDFYNSVVPAAQKVIDSLQQQQIGTKHLTTVVADEAGQMLTLAGNNTAARATIIALINNALGPGTVSFKTLNTWVKNNAGTMSGFKAIVDKSTIAAGRLANVLQSDLNVMFAQALLRTSGASKALQAYTNDLVHNTATTSGGRADRQRLIADLEKSGLSAKQATAYVNGLTGSIKNIPGSKNVHIVMQGDGSYRITGLGPRAIRGGPAQLKPLAAGGRVPGSGTGDTVPAMLTPGEVVVPVSMVKAGAVDHLRGQLPGFASGGLVLQGNQGVLTGSGVAPMYKDFETHFGQAMLNRMYATLKTAEKAAIAARAAAQAAASGIGGSYGDSGARSASAAIAQAFARSIMPQFGWPASMWPAWQALGNEESGWNAYAVNASSGAYGIGQALGHGHPYNLGDYKTQVIWMADYIRSRYGNPVKAYAFENSHSPAWYSKGGLVPPARGYAGGGLITEPIAGVGLRTGTPYSFGERGREWVVPDSGRRPGNGRTGPLVQTGDLYVREAADVDLIAQRLAFSLGVS